MEMLRIIFYKPNNFFKFEIIINVLVSTVYILIMAYTHNKCIQIERKELTKTLTMISNWKNT